MAVKVMPAASGAIVSEVMASPSGSPASTVNVVFVAAFTMMELGARSVGGRSWPDAVDDQQASATRRISADRAWGPRSARYVGKRFTGHRAFPDSSS